MPSHISHAILAEDLADTLGDVADAHRALLVAGAQGPDFFLHNHHRRPRGFRYGALLHRKGNAALLVSLARSSACSTRAPEIAAYALGYLSHVWLDRIAHPFINWHAGWRGKPDNHPERPMMHAFLERIIDVQLLRDSRDQRVADYRFVDRLPDSIATFSQLRPDLEAAIRAALVSTGGDARLSRRLLNALYDSLAFYRFTESPDEEYFRVARERERSGEISGRWLSLVHPPESLLTVDALNRSRTEWAHPCRPEQRSTASLPELVKQAREASLECWKLWQAAAARPSEQQFVALHRAIGEENLNDGITADPPCRRRDCDPLPLLELYASIKRAFER